MKKQCMWKNVEGITKVKINNSIQFFIINVLSQQLQRQLQTQHNVLIGNKIKSNNNSITNINSIIQFNSILYYLCAECQLQTQHSVYKQIQL
jgi:hypothetical protein